VEIRIGIQSVARELIVETDTPAEDIQRDLTAALATEHALFVVKVQKGGKVMVPADKLAYVEFIGSGARHVGF
jgi:hypothetical protein